MKRAVFLCNFTPFGSARIMADLAREAEEAGWEGFFIWDEIAGWPGDMVDPFVALTAAAMTTSRIRLGALITPLARRRPWVVARQTASIDVLSGGRMIFGAGLGGGPEAFDNLGEEANARTRGEMLDEALEVLNGLWSGETYRFQGEHYQITDAKFNPAPLQRPRIPVWVAGVWPHKAPLRRMARWDGMVPHTFDVPDRKEEVRRLRAMTEQVRDLRGGNPAPFDVALISTTPTESRQEAGEVAALYREAGATWFLEAIDSDRRHLPVQDWNYGRLRERILAGPPPLF